MVHITTTKATNTAVFYVPITLQITSILGKDSAGSANNNARTGPLPMPLFINPCRIGISENLAKYINTTTIEAKKFENKDLPRINLQSIHLE